MKEYTAHEFACIFPLHANDSLIELSDSIKASGQREEIVLYEGKILDGRRRYAACIRAGVEPRFRKFGSRATDGSDPLEFAFQVNYYRRDLTEAERTMAAVGYANLKRGYNPNNFVNSANAGKPPISQKQAAAKFNVSEAALERAKRVMEHGAPELQEAMKGGEVSISDAAAIAGEPHDLQRQAVKDVIAEKASTLQAAIAATRPEQPERPEQIVKALEPIRLRLARVETANIEARDLVCRSLQTAQILIAKL